MELNVCENESSFICRLEDNQRALIETKMVVEKNAEHLQQ